MRFKWRALRAGEVDFELIWLAATVTAGVIAAVWLTMHLPLPRCTFRAVTGVPCLTCGATRSFDALLHADLWQAVRTNPLVVTAIATIALFDLYALGVLLMRSPRLRVTFALPSARRVVLVVVGTAAALNWLYLLRSGI